MGPRDLRSWFPSWRKYTDLRIYEYGDIGIFDIFRSGTGYFKKSRLPTGRSRRDLHVGTIFSQIHQEKRQKTRINLWKSHLSNQLGAEFLTKKDPGSARGRFVHQILFFFWKWKSSVTQFWAGCTKYQPEISILDPVREKMLTEKTH